MVIKENRISNNHLGISISSSATSKGYYAIFHNNFLKNWQHASDPSNNSWDGGYPAGGNYWDDYTGRDTHDGENQSLPGADGIGDTPYVIPNGSSRDRYPLMNPWSDVKIEILSNDHHLGIQVRFTYVGPDASHYLHGMITVHGALDRINRTIGGEGDFARNTTMTLKGVFWGFGLLQIHVNAEEAMRNTTGIQFLLFTFIRESR